MAAGGAEQGRAAQGGQCRRLRPLRLLCLPPAGPAARRCARPACPPLECRTHHAAGAQPAARAAPRGRPSLRVRQGGAVGARSLRRLAEAAPVARTQWVQLACMAPPAARAALGQLGRQARAGWLACGAVRRQLPGRVDRRARRLRVLPLVILVSIPDVHAPQGARQPAPHTRHIPHIGQGRRGAAANACVRSGPALGGGGASRACACFPHTSIGAAPAYQTPPPPPHTHTHTPQAPGGACSAAPVTPPTWPAACGLTLLRSRGLAWVPTSRASPAAAPARQSTTQSPSTAQSS
jgi:hypothetical protein